MKVIVKIRENESGKIVKFTYFLLSYIGMEISIPNSLYIWEEGNYACDCQRHIFFIERSPEYCPETEIADHPCGKDKYSIKIEALDGKILYDEFIEDLK